MGHTFTSCRILIIHFTSKVESSNIFVGTLGLILWVFSHIGTIRIGLASYTFRAGFGVETNRIVLTGLG